MLAIYKKELRAYFTSVIGWMFLAFFLAFVGLYVFLYNFYFITSLYYLFVLNILSTLKEPFVFNNVFSFLIT